MLEVADEAVATSSTRVRHWRAGGTEVHHLIDPDTNRPGGDGLVSVTVVSSDPAWAEVWSKVLFLEGRTRSPASPRHRACAHCGCATTRPSARAARSAQRSFGDDHELEPDRQHSFRTLAWVDRPARQCRCCRRELVRDEMVAPSVRNRYFPWITGRALGIGAYPSLCALVILGTWSATRGACGKRSSTARPASRTCCPRGGDRPAHRRPPQRTRDGLLRRSRLVGCAHSREVALPHAAGRVGVVGFWAMVLLTVSAGLAGRGTAHWLWLHRFAALSFVSVWLHGVWSGTDTWRLRILYLGDRGRDRGAGADPGAGKDSGRPGRAFRRRQLRTSVRAEV